MICYNKIYQHYISFDDGVNYVEIHLAIFPKFTFKKEANAEYYRIKSSEWKFLRGWNAGIYDVLKAFLDDPDSVTSQIRLKTVLNNASGVPIRTYYEGFLKLAECEVDAEGEAIRFTPDTDDDYSWYENLKSIKYNPNTIVAYQQLVTYTGTPTRVRIFQYDGGAGAVGVSEFNETCGAEPDAWAVGNVYVVSDLDNGWAKHPTNGTFKCQIAHTASAANEPPPGGNAYWSVGTPYLDFVRFESDVPYDGWDAGNGVYDTGYPNVTALVGGATNADEGTFYKKVCTAGSQTKTLCTRARKLIDFTGTPDDGVLNMMLQTAGQSYAIVSQFFNDATHPVTGVANRLLNLILSTKEMVINSYGSSNVNDGISFEEFFKMIRETFNCYWYISGTNLIIEHLSYFEEGLTYGGSPTVGTDLTDSVTYPARINNTIDPSGNDANNKYSFANFEFPEREKWKFAEQLGNDGYIEYSSKIVEKEKEITHAADFITTDLELVVKFPEQVEENGWMILACDGSNEVLKADARKLGYIPGQGAPGTLYSDVLNGDLYWDNLLPNFWRHGRSLTNIVINGTASTALSLKRAKKQDKIRFQRQADITITDLIKTFMGEAEVDQMEVDTESDWILVSLLHDI